MKIAVRITTLVAPFALLFIAGCSRSTSTSADQPATTSTPLETAPAVATSPSPGDAGETESGPTAVAGSPVGTWGFVTQALELRPDGTGTLEYGAGGPEAALPVTWRRDGDSIVVRRDGQPDINARVEGNKYLVLTSAGGEPVPMPAIRLTEDQARAIASAPGPSPQETAAAGARAQQAACMSNLKQLSLAMLMYCQDYGERYPAPRQDWAKVAEPYYKNRSILQCPVDPELPSYALNGAVAGHSLSDVAAPAELVLLFESDDTKTVAYRHNDGANYGFADGHCKWLKRGGERAGAVVWSLGRSGRPNSP